jgi:hypothetical protein
MSDWNTPLTFTAQEANSKIAITPYGSVSTSGLQYRRGNSGEWQECPMDTLITLYNVGDIVQIQNTKEYFSSGPGNYFNFRMYGKIAASGNIMALMNYLEYCKSYCFSSLFSNCGSLTQAPELPAMTLAERCYLNMFSNCDALTQAPELPAKTLAEGCYDGMFHDSKGLTQAPKLPAMTLAEGCYRYMFAYCDALTQAPELPAKTLAEGCYRYMFDYCKSLNYIEVNFPTWSDTQVEHWVFHVASTGTFVKPSALPEEYGTDRIPTGWTVENIDLEITVVTPVAITGIQNTAIDETQLEATCTRGKTPTFTAEGLPAGVTCSASGLISGTPQIYGDFTAEVTVSADGAESKTIEVNFSIAEDVQITLTETVINTEIRATNTFEIDLKQYASVSNGTVPFFSTENSVDGVTLSRDGVLSGSIASEGEYSFDILVSATNADDKNMTVNIYVIASEPDPEPDPEPETPEITVVSPVSVTGKQNTAITSVQLQASVSDGGTPIFSAADLPAGVTCSASGLISGTPQIYGLFVSEITVTYSKAEAKTITVYFNIAQDIPDTPTDPEEPDIPDEPENPDEPQEPEKPDTPGGDMNFEFKKRLIGAEDINFDITGEDERADFKDFFGNDKVLHKINAAHLPLTKATRTLLDSENVDAALKKIGEQLENIADTTVGLEADKTVTIRNADSPADINIAINNELKNLNNHKLTYKFPADITQLLLTNIIWNGFYNGELIIDGQNSHIYDQTILQQLFKLVDCDCKVEIRNFIFHVQYSKFAVYLENCSQVIIRNCQFFGNSTNPSNAVGGILYKGYFTGCDFYNIGQAVNTEQTFDDVAGAIQFCKVTRIDSDSMLTAVAEDGKTYSLQYNITNWED